MKRLVLAALVALTVSPALALDPVPTSDGQAIAQAEAAVAAKLKDPYSAKFSHVRVTERNKVFWNVCGYVNAKNGYGGYVGERLFSWISGANVAIIESDGMTMSGLCGR